MITNNSASIIRGWIAKSERPQNKYNQSLRSAVEDWSGVTASDSRGAEDTGEMPEFKNFN